MKHSRSHPRSNLPFDCGDVLDLVLLRQDLFLRDVEQCLERLEVGVPVSDQVVIVILSKMYRCFHFLSTQTTPI